MNSGLLQNLLLKINCQHVAILSKQAKLISIKMYDMLIYIESLPQNQPSKYQQYPTRSPFSSVENHKGLPKTDLDSAKNRPVPPTATPNNQNPYFNQYQQLKRASNSNHQNAIEPKVLQHSNSKTQGSHDYSIQFKVGAKKEPKESLNDTNLSQMINNNNQYKQFTCMSPTQNRDNSIIFQSPHQKAELLQSPVLPQKMSYNVMMQQFQQQQQQQPQQQQSQSQSQQLQLLKQQQQLQKQQQTPQLSQQQSQQFLQYQQQSAKQSSQIVNYTNTTVIQQQLKKIQEENLVLTQKTQILESDIQRGTSSTFIFELEQKIKLLSQMNMKFQKENEELINLQDVDTLKQSLSNLLNDRKSYQQSINQIKQECQLWNAKNEEMTQKCEEMPENQGIKELVLELENKVQNLIVENDRLNGQLNSNMSSGTTQEIQKIKSEVEQLQKKYNMSKKEEENQKLKYSNAEKKYEQMLEQNVYADLKEKIQLLVEENDRLQGVINDSEYNDQDIDDLKERIRVVKLDNQKMEKVLKKK